MGSIEVHRTLTRYGRPRACIQNRIVAALAHVVSESHALLEHEQPANKRNTQEEEVGSLVSSSSSLSLSLSSCPRTTANNRQQAAWKATRVRTPSRRIARKMEGRPLWYAINFAGWVLQLLPFANAHKCVCDIKRISKRFHHGRESRLSLSLCLLVQLAGPQSVKGSVARLLVSVRCAASCAGRG